MQDPVFVLSLRPRSGTNILWFHLLQHPDIRGCSLYEDYFVTHIKHLTNYVNEISSSQRKLIGNPHLSRLEKDLKLNLGYGLKQTLNAPVGKYVPIPVKDDEGETEPQKRVITKTPSIEGLEHIFDFLPKSKVLVLLRDPRDVIDSEMKAFGREFRSLVLAWRDAARMLLRFLKSSPHLDKCKIARYENLVRDPEEVVREMLDFLELNISAYDFSKVKAAPVIGSSDDLAKGNWTYKEKENNFKPVGKWHKWHAQRLTYFDKIAGEEARRLGYK